MSRSVSVVKSIGGLLAAWVSLTLFSLFVLENEPVARSFVSIPAWTFWLEWTGGELQQTPQGLVPIASLGGIAAFSLLIVLLFTTSAAWSSLPRSPSSTGKKKPTKGDASPGFLDAFQQKGMANAFWSLPIAAWSVGWIVSLITPGNPLVALLVLTARLALAATLASWLWELIREWLRTTSTFPGQDPSVSPSPLFGWGGVLIGMAVYVVIFTGMNWGLWFNLQLPHGDSSMYEEHLWNFLHGKGFRSYLDQGLFLGEHIQVVHLLLLPLYFFWRSHLLLELCESIALASGAIPVFLMTRRYTGSARAGTLMAWAYLLYFPMQYVDIAIDLKTFRPSAFGFPSLLFMIEAAERRRWGWMTFCVLISLSVQEDYAIPVACYGLWLLVDGLWKGWTHHRTESESAQVSASSEMSVWTSLFQSQWRSQVIAGGLMTVLAPLYLLFVLKVALPWFRDGVTIHYASYFQAFGTTPGEIVVNILTNPMLLLSHLLTTGSVVLLLDLLLPIGMPLRAWRQLLVGVPLFILLCLNELTKDFPGPFHHFHAPLVPIWIWAACTALVPKSATAPDEHQAQRISNQRALWAFCTAFTTGIFFSLSPLGIAFWDSGSMYYWKKLYVPDERAREFAKVLPLIPQNARVASTDFVHPRFTHHERSYDYSNYPRRVANYEDKVPDDTEFIVIDTGHRYSEIKSFEQTREYRNQRDQWEVVPVDTKGYFIVLKRVKFPDGESRPVGNQP